MPEVLMPRLSDTMTEGVLSQWLMSEGEQVHRGDILAEIETDKATMELEAYETGTLTKILVAEGTTVPIGEPLAIIGTPAEAAEPSQTPPPPPPAEAPPDAEAPVHSGTEAGSAPTAASGQAPGTQPERARGGQLRATPLVRSLARERGIDLATVRGSGPNGRIIRADLDAVLADQQAPTRPPTPDAPPAPPAAPSPRPPAAAPSPAAGAGPDDETVPLSQVRRVTAQRLADSAAAPHFHVTMVADVTALLDFRRQVNDSLAADEERVSVTDLLVRACAVVLRAHPEVNAAWAGDHIVRRGHVNVGVAVALEEGLIVPVVRDADRMTLREIAVQAHDLGDRARAGTLQLAEFTGGTFTISNLGMFGVREFNAVINPPEAAILAVGAAVPTPVV
ncbi:MAG TPA: dihydrolipoamide acetyltransferase family protein, partial [Segeticoccus sp.]|uniref:dihydrolipoamide acetyltransferase family protein n=1 Tax=Segeticoccus sp. TaxID=2706531 RepID=UPI002D7FB969